MQFTEVTNSSKQALQGNPLRTWLTMLGIIIGISSVILITSIGQGALAYITQELSVFGSSNFRVAPGQNSFTQVAATANPLTTKDAQAIQDSGITNIELVAPLSISTGVVSTRDEKTRSTIRGIPPEVEQIFQPKIIHGEFISDINNTNQEKVAVIGHNLSDELFGPDTNPVGEFIRLDGARYRVIGVSQASSGISGDIFNDNVIVPINSLITHITGVDELFQIVVKVENEEFLNQTSSDVETFLRDYRDIAPEEDADFFIQSFDETISMIQTITSLLTIMVAGVSGISLIVGGIGVMNIMLVTVTERTREIGLLKAVGAKEKDILSQFLIESITLTVVGGSIGVFLGLSGAFAISQVTDLPFVTSLSSVIVAVGVSSLVGIIFGIYPARRAAKLSPIDALRYE